MLWLFAANKGVYNKAIGLCISGKLFDVRTTEQEEEANICDGVIYADPGRRSRFSTQGGYLRVCTSTAGFVSGGYNLGV